MNGHSLGKRFTLLILAQKIFGTQASPNLSDNLNHSQHVATWMVYYKPFLVTFIACRVQYWEI